MRIQLISLEKKETSEELIELEDQSSGSMAIYRARNPDRKSFFYFSPDELRLDAPQCDYVLASLEPTHSAVRFIELKGHDSSRDGRCCKTEWDHAFHQLFCTYDKYKDLIDLNTENIIFILCTSMQKKRIAAKFEKYRWYKMLQQQLHVIRIIYGCDDDETV